MDNLLAINLMLTTQCNFECGHCFYSCGPDNNPEYMNSDILDTAIRAAEQLDATINLIGGEPTLNLPAFERIFDRVTQSSCNIEMTTNGWWLDKPAAAARFMRIVRNAADYSQIQVRISNDRFHQEFWKRDKANLLDELFECPEDYFGCTYYCPECGREKGDHFCAECAEECDSEPNIDFNLPEPPNTIDPWIWVEKDRSYEPVPNGRGIDQWQGIFLYGCQEYSKVCGLTYRPDGTVTDPGGCGCGMILGSYKDDPAEMLARAERFVTEMKPGCLNCLEQWDKWTQGGMQ